MIKKRTSLEVCAYSFICLLLLILPAMMVRAESPQGPDSWVDRDRFPEAYSILTSDRILFPGDVSDWPLKIDSTHQLFVDDFLISEIEHLTRQFHQPVKHPGNPLMPGVPVAVLYDNKSGKFRMWYSMNYAESTDGIHWRRPNLGPQGNRIFNSPGEVRGFIFNPDATDPQRRYEAVIEKRANEKINEKGGFYAYRSADGLHWKESFKRPILKRTYSYMNPGPFWAKGVGDTCIFRYDPVLKKYICDTKFNLYFPKEKIKQLGIVQELKPRLRLRAFMESDDLVHWSRERFLMFPDRLDPPDRQFYGHIGFVYESMWVGMIRTLCVIPKGFKQVDIQLSYSRDGRHWSRPRQRKPFIPLGTDDSWDADYLGPVKIKPALVGNELWFYYFGARNANREDVKNWSFGIGLAKLRRDGFASLNAGQTPGQIVTRPMTFKGEGLFVNAEVADGGWVKAAVLSRDSEPIESYTLDDSIALTRDTTKGRMAWKSNKELVPPGEDHLRILFRMKNARLYSFWIDSPSDPPPPTKR
ncbi:MAG: hypothetical protein J7M40_11030 [Planctomycetes bacterium]|nr:hypothetical protein [Planctomycetota bacterium]